MDAPAKQQIVERIKQANNILVTVSSNPSVDQLAACIGLTLLLNKMQKHATAVFSGKVPSTLEFLQPEKTIETNTDSLQDFIISLDKAKADKLRYKVEDQVVRIFITPYRTSIGPKDLVFSQGDFNVEVVLALGIKDRNQIDQAIAAHGRILHDATVISLNAGAGAAPQLGQLNWQEPTASSLCEMLVSISEAFGGGLIDNQMATAFLTGIVAETERFSNPRTSPKVMTMAAQLMAAGANQQLIVSELEPPPPPPPKYTPPEPAKPVAAKPKPVTPPPPPPKPDGALSISHDKAKPEDKAKNEVAEVQDTQEVQIQPNEIHIDKFGNIVLPEEVPAAQASKTKNSAQPTPLPVLTPTPVLAPTLAPAPAPLPKLTPLTPTDDLPPLPLQPPPPSIITHSTPSMESASLNPKPLTPGPATSPHAIMDPQSNPGIKRSPFTADMQSDWNEPYSSVSMDPLTDKSAGAGDQKLFTHHDDGSDTAQPAPDAATDVVANARNAVQNALQAAPFDPGFAAPVTSLNASPVGGDLHANATPSAPTGIPSLSLPANGNGPVQVVQPYMPPPDDPAPPAPPPVPPPLPLSANPGAMVPSTPTFKPPQPAA